MAGKTGLSDRTLTALKVASAAIATVGAGIGIWQAVKPGPGPPRRAGAVKIAQATPMTLGQYLERRGKRIPGVPVRFRGTYVAYAVTAEGFKGKNVKVAWRLLTDNGAEQARTADTQPGLAVDADYDRSTYSTWVQDPRGKPRRFAIEIDLYDEKGTELDQDSRTVVRR